MTERDRSLALAAALTTVLLWSSAFVGVRVAGEDLSPGPLTLARLLVGALVLGVVVAARREALPPRRDLPRLALCGLLWFGAYNVLLNAAEQRVDAGTAAMLVNVGPVLIAVLAGILLREGFPRTLVVGCAVAFAGAIVIGLATRGQSADAGWGAVLCVGAAAAYAGAVVAQKPLLERTSALQVTFLACVTARPGTRAPGRSRGRRTSACSRPPSALRRGPTRCGARPPGRWARRPTSCRPWPSCSAGCCSARRRPPSRSPAARCAWPAWRSRAGRGCRGGGPPGAFPRDSPKPLTS